MKPYYEAFGSAAVDAGWVRLSMDGGDTWMWVRA